MFAGTGLVEILVIAFLILLFFGVRKLPELVRGIGNAVKEFKIGAKEDESGAKKTGK